MGKAGEALRQVLQSHGISQNRLAVEIGIRRSVVNNWVNEINDPSANAVLEIRKGLQAINPEAAEEFIRLYLSDD